MDFMHGAALALPQRCVVPRASAGSLPPYTLTPVDGQISRIVPILAPGAVVTTTRAHAHSVATKYGTAMLLGRSLAERARSLSAIAAPAFCEQLERAAYERITPARLAGSCCRPNRDAPEVGLKVLRLPSHRRLADEISLSATKERIHPGAPRRTREAGWPIRECRHQKRPAGSRPLIPSVQRKVGAGMPARQEHA